MKKYNRIFNTFGAMLLLTTLFLFLAPDFAEARRGGFGGSRGFSRRSTPSRSKSFGNKRQSSKQTAKSAAAQRKQRVATQKRTPSFGGNRISSSAARSKYGTPRRTEKMSGKNAYGSNQNYVVNHYGGYSSGLMTGYMMGSITSSMMWMPWYGAFWYSRPYYTSPDANGQIHVYPPSFSWGKLFLIIVIVLVVIFIIKAWRRNKQGRSNRGSIGGSFG